MKKKTYINPEIRVMDLGSEALLDEGFSETPSDDTPEVNDTELDSNRGLFDSDEGACPLVNVWE